MPLESMSTNVLSAGIVYEGQRSPASAWPHHPHGTSSPPASGPRPLLPLLQENRGDHRTLHPPVSSLPLPPSTPTHNSSASIEPQAKQQRKANWGDDESLQLAALYRDEVHLVRMILKSEGISSKKKHGIWKRITAELNTQFNHGRTAVEVKKRWFTISSKSRLKIQQFKQYGNGTGGGPVLPPLGTIDEPVEKILGKDNKTIMGIEGVDDTGLQKKSDLVDQEPSLDLSVGDGGTEATTALAVVASEVVPEPSQVTLQPFEVVVPQDAAPAQMTLAGLQEEAAAARAKAAAAEEEADAARAAAGAARAQEEAARAMKAAAEEVAACVRALAGAARAGEAAERAREVAAKEKAEAMRLNKFC